MNRGATRPGSDAAVRPDLTATSLPRPDEPDARHLRRVDLWTAGIVLAYILPLLWRIPSVEFRIMGQNDTPWHMDVAPTLKLWPPDPQIPHFLNAALVRVLTHPLGLHGAQVVVLVAAVVAGGLVISRNLRLLIPAVRAETCAAIAVIVTIGQSPTVLVREATEVTLGHAYLPLNTFMNPTSIVVLPFAFWQFRKVVELVRSIERGEATREQRAVVATIVVLTMVAKPSLDLALIPALVLVLLPRWRRVPPPGGRPRAIAQLATAVALPFTLVFAWQTWMVTTQIPEVDRGSFAIRPFAVLDSWGFERPDFWLVLLLPAVAIWVCSPRRPLSFELRVALVTLAVAFTIGSLMAETGNRSGDAAYTAPIGVAISLVTVYAVHQGVARAWVDGRPWGAGWRAWVLAGCLGLTLAAGLAAWAMDMAT